MLHKYKYTLAILLLLGLAVSGCARKEIIVPSLTPVPSGEQLTGKFVWYDLFTHDMQTTVKFYNRIFGWTFTDTAGPGTPVKTIRRQGIPMANVVQIAPEKMDANESAWLGYSRFPMSRKRLS